MLNISRRDFVVSTGLAAALGLNARLAVSPAFAQKTADPGKPFVTYKVGSAEVTAIYDGIWEKPHDPAFISNASVDDVKAAMTKAGLPTDFVSIPFTVVIVKTGGKTIMCDAGTGGQVAGAVSGKLAAGMKAAGIDPAKIDTILISHCHPDHIFGLMEKDTNKALYPNAELVIADVEYKFWTDPAVIDKLPEARKGLARRIQATFPTWKNIKQVTGEVEVAPGIRTVMAPGHTPGHRAFHLSSGSSQLMISNDTMYVPALVVANPGWHGQYDQDANTAEATRIKMMDRLVADKMMVCGYHFPFPAAGVIEKDGSGYALTINKA
jgi:glyoxylase-like metal-dependent hydrolase (beta-lactamase superfamily II)